MLLISFYLRNSPINLLNMSNDNYPIPPSHKTFNFGSVVFDSNFDSGNCSDVEKVSSNQVS